MDKIIYCTLLGLVLTTTGCQNVLHNNTEDNISQQEYILNKVNNHRGLIKLYRDKLNRKENAEDRYKLAKCYYLVEDYSSSRLYLQPLLSNSSNENALLLESKNLLELGKNDEALITVSRILQYNKNNGEAWNLKGILLSERGDFRAALQAFEGARKYFFDEDIVINNMAMLEILQENYSAARDHLIPLYNRGQVNQKMLHNLVFALAKLQDFSSAENILNEQNMTLNAVGLLESLTKIKPLSQNQLQHKISSGTMTSLSQIPTKTTTELSHTNIPKVLPQEKTVQRLPTEERAMNNSSLITESQAIDVPAKEIVAPVIEKASLTAARNLKEISSIRVGQHKNYFRMTLESPQAINYREINSTTKNKHIVELLNVKLTENMLQARQKLPKGGCNIRNLTFYQKEVDVVIVEFELEQSVTKNNIFRLPKNKKNQERLIFDIYL